MPVEYDLEIQARLPTALCAIHNITRDHGPNIGKPDNNDPNINCVCVLNICGKTIKTIYKIIKMNMRRRRRSKCKWLKYRIQKQKKCNVIYKWNTTYKSKDGFNLENK